LQDVLRESGPALVAKTRSRLYTSITRYGLRECIANGETRYRKTRTLALETALSLLDVMNE